jgi:lysozyme family protein
VTPPEVPPTPFDRWWAFLQRPDVEGGDVVVDDSDDPGGVTRWGISQRAYPHEDIAHLTEARAQMFARRDYWEPCRCDDLPDALALIVADAAFNQGPGAAIDMLQTALGVKVDHVIGPVTIAAAFRGGMVINEMFAQRLLRYANGQGKYRRGWFLRILKLKDVI